MSNAQREKGLSGEREVAKLFEDAGYDVRKTFTTGDALCISRDGQTIHLEAKRQERLQLWQWLKQAKSEAPKNVPPVVAFRRNHGEWYACLSLDDLLRIVSG